MDIDSLLIIPFRISKLFGLDLSYPNNSNKLNEILNFIVFCLCLTCVSFAIIGETFWFVEEANAGGRFGDLIFIAACGIFGIITIIKCLSLWFNKYQVISFINSLKDIQQKYEVIHNCNSLEDEINAIIKITFKYFNTILKILTCLNLSLLILFIIKPGLIIIYTLWTTGTYTKSFPFKIKYPFDINSTEAWVLVYIQQIFAGSYAVFFGVSYDALFIVFCACLQMHFTIIRHRIENLISKSGQDVHDELRKIIIDHKHLIEMVQLLRGLNYLTIFFNFVTSCGLICLTLFQVSTMEDPEIWISFLLTSLSQLFLVCYCGNMIKISSVAVTDGVFESKWYLASPRTRRDLTLLMARTQIPCKLTAWKYADVDIEAFARILSSSWSYFALIRSLYTRNLQS